MTGEIFHVVQEKCTQEMKILKLTERERENTCDSQEIYFRERKINK